jgi:hypothetical protein
MRKLSHPCADSEPAQNGPARRVDAIAANFLTRKILPLDDRGSQASACAKSGATRPSRPAADNRDIEHLSQSVKARCASRSGGLQTADPSETAKPLTNQTAV